MTPDKLPIVRREEQLSELLFQVSGEQLTEVTLPAKFPVDENATPLFKGNLVSQPLAIAKEGEYVKVFQEGDKMVMRKIRITGRDLESMVANSTRDVPLNAEHIRYGPNYYGWVRSKSLPMEVRVDTDGRKALFAQVEVTPDVVQMVENGRYRDFSPELDLLQKRLKGLALTNYPVMQEIHQFSEAVEEVGEAPPLIEDFQEEQMDIEAIKEQLRDEMRAAMDASFSEQLNALKQELDAERNARLAAEREARNHRLTLEFSEKIRQLVKDDEGKARILPAQAEAVLNLYLFAAQHGDNTIEFGEGESAQALTPVQLLDEVFSNLPAVKLFEQHVDESASEPQDERFSEQPDGAFDVKAVASQALSILREQL